MQPAVGMLLERVVPSPGAEVGNGGAEGKSVWLPEGTIVGVNPWVSSRRRDVFGEDVNVFRPERWLEVEGPEGEKGERGERARAMERSFLAVSCFFSIHSYCLTQLSPMGKGLLGRVYLLTGRCVNSSAPAVGRAWARTSPCWKCRNWCRSC